MSLNDDVPHQGLLDEASHSSTVADSTHSADPTAGHVANRASENGDGLLQPKSVSHEGFLDVPSHPPSRRPSIQSEYSLSDLSELSYHASAQHEPLMRTDSAASQPPAYTQNSPLMRKLYSIWVTNYGALLVLAAQFFGCLMNLSTRLLETPGQHGPAMHPYQILFARQGITAAVCITYGVYTKSIPDFPFGPRGVRWLLILRGVGGFFGVFGLYFSLLYLPLSEATVLTFLGPILTCYVCSLVLTGETFTRQQQMAAFVSLAGVVLIARPLTLLKLFSSSSSSSSSTTNNDAIQALNATISAAITHAVSSPHPKNATSSPAPSSSSSPPQPTPAQHLSAIGISLIGVLGATCAMTSIRAIGTRAHPFISINYFSVWCTIVSLACLVIFPDVKFRLPGNWTEWGLLASLGVCGFVMQWLLTEGLAYGSASNAKVGVGGGEADVEAQGGAGRAARKQGPAVRVGEGVSGRGKNRVIKGAGTRATSMVYTQMLFALAGDKIVFGVIPTALSWLGSGLILAGAVWVAAARDQPDTSSGGGDGGERDAMDRRRESLAGGGMELNTVAANAVGFGGVSIPTRDQRASREEAVGLMADVDDLDELYDDDEVKASTPSGSNSRNGSNSLLGDAR